MNTEAIFSDGTRDYRRPAEPNPGDKVLITLRVGANDRPMCYLVSNQTRYEMSFSYEEELFCYYTVNVRLEDKPFFYYFEINQDGTQLFYDRVGLTNNVRKEYSFAITPGFSTPDWAKGAVMYQIYVDRFCNGDTTNDVETNEYYYIQVYSQKVDQWDKVPASFGVGEFYGGDLEGVRQKLYYLKSLGVEVIYFNPLFVSPSNHKYDIADYDYIDPHYGKIVEDGGQCLQEGDRDNRNATKYKQRVANFANLEASNKFFAQFVEEAHEKGIRVILDGVFNHCGSFNKWLNREGIYDKAQGHEVGAYESKESPYNSYFKFIEDKWPNNYTYEGWWGHDTLPKLNYEGSKELYDYILRIGAKWVSPPYNVDGWRLDVAADLGHSEEFNHQFWRDFRDAVKKANPNAIILAEHYGDPAAWMSGDQWDTIMNYDAFMEPLTYFLTGMEKHSDEYDAAAVGDGERFRRTMEHFMTRMMTLSLHCSMNQLSNHDHSRFLTRTNRKVGRADKLGADAASENVDLTIMKMAAMVQMTWPGAPTLYYGDEAGVCGFTDPDNRRTYPWGKADYSLVDFHRDIIYVHKTSTAIRRGSFMFMPCGKDFISYARFTRDEAVVVVINMSNHPMEIEIPVWKIGAPTEGFMTGTMMVNDRGYSIMPVQVAIKGGIMTSRPGPRMGVVYKIEK